MAHVSLDVHIGDFISPIMNFGKSILQPTHTMAHSMTHSFDKMMLRIIAVILLLSTTVLMVLCIPHAVLIVESLILTVVQLINSTTTAGRMYSQLLSSLPLIFLLLLN
jgi:hypothetical protein